MPWIHYGSAMAWTRQRVLLIWMNFRPRAAAGFWKSVSANASLGRPCGGQPEVDYLGYRACIVPACHLLMLAQQLRPTQSYG